MAWCGASPHGRLLAHSGLWDRVVRFLKVMNWVDEIMGSVVNERKKIRNEFLNRIQSVLIDKNKNLKN